MLERISKLIKTKKLSSSQFADEIGVQRSSVSHVLSGRNKPSLDFVTKILTAYEDINSEWLLIGKGNMFSMSEDIQDSGLLPLVEAQHDEADPIVVKSDKIDDTTGRLPSKKKIAGSKHVASGRRTVEKVVLFYDDGTFREFSSE